MRRSLFLISFFAGKRVASRLALMLTLLAFLLILSGFLSTVIRIESYARVYGLDFGGSSFSIPVQTIDKGSVHAQIWDATDSTYLHSYPIIGGALLPLRFATPWLLIVLPFVGMLISACGVSGELETGLAQVLYGAPVPRSVLGMCRILGDSVVMSLLIAASALLALLLGSRLVDFEISSIHIARSAVFLLVLGFYTSIFVLVGNLVSTLTRRSTIALFSCVIVGLGVIGADLAGENVMNSLHEPYTSLPGPPPAVNRLLTALPPSVVAQRSDEDLQAAGGAQLARYMMELGTYADGFHSTLRADYQRERWIALISPVHAIWEVAQQLLQDRHNASTEIFAPVPAMDPPPSIRRSLAAAWPELVGLAVAWFALFAINVRVLSRLEV